MDQKLLDLHLTLQSRECFKFLYKKLDQQLIWRKTLPKRKELNEKVLENEITIEGIPSYDPMKDFKENYIFTEDQFKLMSRDGLIAGGCIAAWLNEFINNVPAQINDIDYFYYDFNTTEYDKAFHKSYESLSGENFDYDIVKVSEEKLLNKIRIHIGKDFTWKSLIQSFDLNCTLVGFDPFNRKLIYHREFLEFLSNRVIEPLRTWSSDAPLNTYTRAYKKSLELKASFYMHKHMQIFLNRRNQYWWKKNQYCFKIVHKNNPDNIIQDTLIEDEWSLSEPAKPKVLICYKNVEKKSIFGFHHNKKEWEELISVKKYNYWRENKKILEPWISLTDDGYAVINKKAFNYPWFNFYQKQEYSQELSNLISYSAVSDIWFSGDREFDDRQDLIDIPFYKKNALYYKQLDFLLKSDLYSLKDWKTFFEVDTNLAKGLFTEFSKTNFDNCVLFLKNHEFFKRLFYGLLKQKSFNYNLKECIDFFNKISKWKTALVGVLESSLSGLPRIDQHQFKSVHDFNSSRYDQRAKDIIVYIIKKNITGLQTFIQDCYNQDLDKDLLAKKINLGKFWDKYVTELNTNSLLIRESEKMKHCVNGYGNSIKKGVSRIFHITINGHHSTLELNRIVEKREDFQEILDKKTHYSLFDQFYSIKQHKAFGNANPHDLCWKVAHILVAYLNNYNEYEIIVQQNNENRERRVRNRREKRQRGEELTRL